MVMTADGVTLIQVEGGGKTLLLRTASTGCDAMTSSIRVACGTLDGVQVGSNWAKTPAKRWERTRTDCHE